MWCSHCQQDLPAIATPDDDKVRCTVCRNEITPRRTDSVERHKPIVSQAPLDSSSTAAMIPEWAFVERPPIDFEAWRWDEDLLEAERLLQTYKSSSSLGPSKGATVTARTKRVNAVHTPRPEISRNSGRQPSRVAYVAWGILSLGVMAFVFGGALLGWSVWSGQQNLWTLGLPFALGGQAALILGLVLQLDGLWQSNGQANNALQEVEEQIDELRQTTALLASSQGDASDGFYAHIAEANAAPNLWLHGLKSQLDSLAIRMAKDG